MKALGLALGVALAAGCGSSEFAGERSGWVSFSSHGNLDYTYSYGPLRLAVSDDGVVSGVCPDGSGEAQLDGDGRWAGALSCPPAWFLKCSESVLTYESAQADFLKSGALHIHAEGRGVGCGRDIPLSVGFVEVL